MKAMTPRKKPALTSRGAPRKPSRAKGRQAEGGPNQRIAVPKAERIYPVLERKSFTGRPSIFSRELADELLFRLSEGETLERVTADSHMPHRVAVWQWCKRDAAFKEQFEEAQNSR